MPNGNSPMGGRHFLPRVSGVLPVLICLFVISGTVPAVNAQNTALLDTIQSNEAPTPQPGWAQADMGISRKLLPEVRATRIPITKSPNRPPRLDDPLAGEYQFYLANKAMNSGNFEQASTNLNKALQADQNQARYQWWHSSQALTSFNPGTFIWALPKSLKAVVQDPLGQKRLVILAHQGLILLTAVFWSVLIAALLLKYWRYLAHDMSAMLFRNEKHKLHVWTPILLPLAILLLRPGWIGFLALISIPMVIQTRGVERRLLVMTWLTMCLLLFPNWPLIRNALPTLDPGSETSLTIQASRQSPDSNLITTLEKKIATTTDPERRARLQLPLAIQKARRGQYQPSSDLFQAILRQDPTNVPAMVGLANNTYYQGRLDAAIEGYMTAQKHAPEQGEIPYNLGQVYFKKLFVPEASQALEKARSLGFQPPPWEDEQGRKDTYSPVVYLGPPLSDMNASARGEADGYAPYTHLASWNYFLGCPPLSIFILLAGSLLMAMAFTFWWSHQNDPRMCGNCGWTICHECCRVHDGVWLCPDCGETADRARSEMILSTLLKNRSVAIGLEHSQRISMLSRILPGAGHLAIGEIGRAHIRLSFLALALYLLLFAWGFNPAAAWDTPGLLLASETVHQVWYPVPAAMWPGWTHWSILLGGVLLIALYVTAMIDGQNIRQRIPERFMATTTPHTEEASPRAV